MKRVVGRGVILTSIYLITLSGRPRRVIVVLSVVHGGRVVSGVVVSECPVRGHLRDSSDVRFSWLSGEWSNAALTAVGQSRRFTSSVNLRCNKRLDALTRSPRR